MNAIAQPSAAPAAGPQLDNRRVLAALVDLVVIAAGVFVLSFAFGMLAGGEGSAFGGAMNAIAVAWALYYYFALESGDGQTLGKKLLKIRVVRADGGAMGMSQVAIRTLLRVIDGLFLYLVGLVIMLVTGERRQRLGDLAAGTVVVDASVPADALAAAAPAVADAPVETDAAPVAEPAAEDESRVDAEESPADLGTPISGMSAPEPEAAEPEPQPEYSLGETHVEPQAQELHAVEPQAVEPQADEPQVELAPAPAEDPEPDIAPAPAEEPEPGLAPAAVEEAEPALEAAPVEQPQATFAPAPAEEPLPELGVDEVEPAPMAEEPVAEEPVAEESAAAEPVAEEPVADEPVADEPAAHEPQGDEAQDDAPMTLRSVDTVSAIDLVMADDEDEDSPQGETPPQSA